MRGQLLPEPEDLGSDEWLTPAEIAEEMGLNPATVRQWITKRELPAMRVGMRKLRIRRSDLEALLAEWQRAEQTRRGQSDSEPMDDLQPPVRRWPVPLGTSESTQKLFNIAARDLVRALQASASAEPSAGYTDRLRAIADGFEHVGTTSIHGARSAGARWAGTEFGFEQLPYELRPGGNRPSAKGLWREFDTAIEKLSAALAGHDLETIGEAYRRACDELLRVAKRIDESGVAVRESDAI
jgi:excisionase family DNA binding protein